MKKQTLVYPLLKAMDIESDKSDLSSEFHWDMMISLESYHKSEQERLLRPTKKYHRTEISG